MQTLIAASQGDPLSIYNYDSVRSYLIDIAHERKRTQPSFSIRKWANEMGLNSHVHLLLLIQGKRPIRLRHAQAISKGLRLTSQEQLYLRALIQFECAGSIEEKQLCQVWLSDLRPQGSFNTRQLEEFIVISHWVHCAILAMTQLNIEFKTVEQIAEKLSHRIALHEVRAAVERMLSLKLLVRDENGVLRSAYESITTKNDVKNEGARQYQKQVIEMSIPAIDSQPLEEREFQSLALSVPEASIPLAKDLIRKFTSQFTRALSEAPGDHVYQMNIQFFKVTK